jgi:hypothetical protein
VPASGGRLFVFSRVSGWFVFGCCGVPPPVVSPSIFGVLFFVSLFLFFVHGLCGLTNLEILNVAVNRLSGTIPDLSTLVNLQKFNFYNNKFSGEFPSWLCGMTSLQVLDIGRNQFYGPLPGELGDLINLISLQLYSNQFTGPIPASIGELTSLTNLSVSGNELSGVLPDLSGVAGPLNVDIRFNAGLSSGLSVLPGNMSTVAVVGTSSPVDFDLNRCSTTVKYTSATTRRPRRLGSPSAVSR